MIDTEAQLAGLLPEVKGADWVAIDTEADSLHAYPEKLCLLQLSLPGSDALIDPLAGLDLAPLLESLNGKELILHGADYDLRLLHRTYQYLPQAIFDTMWAARLLGHEQFGLSDLVRQHLGEDLEKGPQKMNWAMRPLPERMARYARNDTRHLHPLAELLRSLLREKGRLDWHREVCARFLVECSRCRRPETDELWRVKGSDRLEPRALAVLRELWRWREEEAIAANRPPYFILSHEKLVAISSAAAHGKKVPGLIPRHFHAKRAAALAAALDQGCRTPATEYPPRRRRSGGGHRLSREQQMRFEHLRHLRDHRARDLGIDPTLIASRADLLHLARDWSDSPGQLMRWQRHLLSPS